MKMNWGTGIVVFFALFVAASIGFVIFSYQYSNDLVVDDYYEKGANYDHQMQIDKRSLIYSDSIWIENNNDAVKVTLAQSIPLNSSNIQAWFYYASNKKMDIISAIEGSELNIERSRFAHGRYTLKLSWTMNNEEYLITKDLFLN